MLGVATISMAVNYLAMLSGSLIAGNLLGPESLAGLNVCTPVFAIASFLSSLISIGAGLVFSQAMGAFDERKAYGVWSQSCFTSLLLGGILFIAMTFGENAYFDFCNVSGVIRDEATSYWRWLAVAMGLSPIVMLAMSMIYADGDSVLSTVTGLCYVIGTIGFSVLFSVISHHAGGISAGTSLAMVMVLVVSAFHFLRSNNHLRFIRCFSRKYLLETLKGSAPDATVYLCWGLLTMVINRFTVAHCGEHMLAVVALGVNVVEFTIIFDGIGEALIPLEGMYAGEGNRSALRELANHSALIAVVEGLIVCGFMLVFAPQIAGLYGFRGETENMLHDAVAIIRILAFAMPFMGFLMMANTHYLIIGHVGFSVSITVLKDFILPCVSAISLGTVLGFSGLWGGVAAGYALAAVVMFIYVFIRYGRQCFPWLIRKTDNSLNFAIRLDSKTLVGARDRIEKLLVARGVQDRIVKRVMLSVEENGIATMEKNVGRSPVVEYFVSFEKPGFLRLVERDDGAAMSTQFRHFSQNRYLNTLDCNRTEHWFKLTGLEHGVNS